MLPWTHRCRIFRTTREQHHDLSFKMDWEDIYGEDKWCRLSVSDGMFLVGEPDANLGSQEQPIEIWFERGVDIRPGFILQVKKTRVMSGAREPVETTLDAATSVDDETLTIASEIGFESGDSITIVGGGNEQQARVKTVADNALTVYDDSSMDYVFPITTTTIVVDYVYVVTSVKVPALMGPVIQVIASLVGHRKVI